MTNSHQNAIAIDIKNTWERVFSILAIAARVANNRYECHQLTGLPQEQRLQFVMTQWGPIAAQKVAAFLDRIEQLEAEHANAAQ